MKHGRTILRKALYPRKPMLFLFPLFSFAALIFVFVSDNTESAPAYVIYCMSAYSLTIWAAAVPKLVRLLRDTFEKSRLLQKIRRSTFGGKYLNDPAFRGSVGIWQGMTLNFFYVIFRIAAGIRYASVWFVYMAVYYLVLGGLRAYLAVCYRRRTPETERRCYRITAWLLFLLNIPMGGMIFLMVRTNSGYSYPGHIIYITAMYTFYAMTLSVINLVKFRRLGSPVLSAAKVLNLTSAMMSVLGLQTAMIARFSADGEDFRRMMNAITGGAVYGTVILIAVYMLFHSRRSEGKVESVE